MTADQLELAFDKIRRLPEERRFSLLALADLEDIASYIEARNPAAARKVVNRIEELCFALGEMPARAGHRR
jgi:plasmid stabilization system protein ParE